MAQGVERWSPCGVSLLRRARGHSSFGWQYGLGHGGLRWIRRRGGSWPLLTRNWGVGVASCDTCHGWNETGSVVRLFERLVAGRLSFVRWLRVFAGLSLSCEIFVKLLQYRLTYEIFSQVVLRVYWDLRNFRKLQLDLQNFRKLELDLINMLCFFLLKISSTRRIFIDLSIYFVIHLQLIIKR